MTPDLTVARVVHEDGQHSLAVLPEFFTVLGLEDATYLVFRKMSDDTFEVTKVTK